MGSPARTSATDTERLHLQLDRRWVKALRREAADHRMTLRAVVERCIAERYDPERKQVGERRLAKDMQRVQRELAQVRFSNAVMVELLARTARSLVERLPAPTPSSTRAGEGFYDGLQSEVARCFERGDPLLERLLKAIEAQAAETASEATPA